MPLSKREVNPHATAPTPARAAPCCFVPWPPLASPASTRPRLPSWPRPAVPPICPTLLPLCSGRAPRLHCCLPPHSAAAPALSATRAPGSSFAAPTPPLHRSAVSATTFRCATTSPAPDTTAMASPLSWCRRWPLAVRAPRPPPAARAPAGLAGSSRRSRRASCARRCSSAASTPVRAGRQRPYARAPA
ncbi:hypothetical protein ACQJBY_058769 [Aegilops geniculata]